MDENSLIVEWKGEELSIPYEKSTTVGDLKKLLWDITTIPVERQTLTGIPHKTKDKELVRKLKIKSHKIKLIGSTEEEIAELEQARMIAEEEQKREDEEFARALMKEEEIGYGEGNMPYFDSSMDISTDAQKEEPSETSSSFFSDLIPSAVASDHVQPRSTSQADQSASSFYKVNDVRGKYTQENIVEMLDNMKVDARFLKEFEKTYGNEHPTMRCGSIRDVISECKRQSRLLLIYFHYDNHDSTAMFCHGTLQCPIVKEVINENFLFWVCQVTRTNVNTLLAFIPANNFPLMAILGDLGGGTGSMSVLEVISGITSPDELFSKLSESYYQYSSSLSQPLQENSVVSESQRFREMQQMEYEKSLLADQQKELEKEKERIEKEKQKEQEEIERQKAVELEQHIAHAREAVSRRVPQEPESNEENITTIRFTLPNGANVQRRFRKTDKIGNLLDFVVSVGEKTGYIPSKRLAVVTSYPKNIYQNPAITLEEAGLFPRAAIHIQEID